MGTTHRIAVIPGDGIGKEVAPEGLRVLQAAASAFDFDLDYEQFDYASADYYAQTGAMLPDGWFDELNRFDAIFFGAVGWPDVVPDHISLWGSLLQFRRALRPVRQPAPGQTAARRDQPAGRPASPATSTSTWCGRTPKASTPASAARSSRAPTAKPSSRKP